MQTPFTQLHKSSQPTNLHISTTSSLFNLLVALALHLWLPSLDHQHHPLYTYNWSLLSVRLALSLESTS